MKYSLLLETSLIFILIALLTVLVNPFGLIMFNDWEMLCTALVVVFFFLFLGLIWREHAADEREELHRYIAARFAYLFGTTILVAGIVTQSLMDALSPWLPIALGGMLLGKILGRIYAERKY